MSNVIHRSNLRNLWGGRGSVNFVLFIGRIIITELVDIVYCRLTITMVDIVCWADNNYNSRRGGGADLLIDDCLQ